MYIVIDGPDAVGKSSAVNEICSILENRGEDVLSVREPGQTKIGAQLREELLFGAEHTPVVQACLFAFDNALTYETVIKPRLDTGSTVISDRGLPSALAYQIGGYQLDPSTAYDIYLPLRKLPILTVLIMPSTFDDWKRLFDQRIPEDNRDRIENEGDSFFRRVFDIYEQMANAGPGRSWSDTVDGVGIGRTAVVPANLSIAKTAYAILDKMDIFKQKVT